MLNVPAGTERSTCRQPGNSAARGTAYPEKGHRYQRIRHSAFVLGTMVIVCTSFESTLWDIDLELRDSDPDSLGHC